jgi:hypothetical protein
MTMGWLPDVVTDEVIASSWGNNIRDRTVTPFANVAARTAAITAPEVGMVTWLDDLKRLEVYNGTSWIPIPAPLFVVTFTIEPLTTGFVAAAGELTLMTPTYNYRMLCELSWGAWHGAGNQSTVRVADITGVQLSPNDTWVQSQAANTVYQGNRTFISAVRNAGVAASIRILGAANAAGGGIRDGYAKVSIIPA